MSTSEEKPIINCHTHILTTFAVPNTLFLGLPIVPLLRNVASRWILIKFVFVLGWLLALVRIDWLHNLLEKKSERLKSMAKIGNIKKGEEEKLFKQLKNSYPLGTQFIVLALDTLFMGKGKRVSQPYENQLKKLVALKDHEEYGKLIYPFIHADPRRPDVTKFVTKWLESGKFNGIKIYPPFGVHPAHDGLDDIYRYALKHKVPIIGHCTPDGLRGKSFGKKVKGPDNENMFLIYSDPDCYKELLDKHVGFENLKLCLAHFGGNTEWKKYLNQSWEEGQEKAWVSKIIDMVYEKNEEGGFKYPNLYVDISYTSFEDATLSYLKVLLESAEHKELQKRVLFGSDFYVLHQDVAERAFSVNIRAHLGEYLFDLIARENPRNFLGI